MDSRIVSDGTLSESRVSPKHKIKTRIATLTLENFRVDFPSEHIIQLTLERPKKLNCIDQSTSREIAKVWDWFEDDASLWVGILTGSGRAFCTGADLDGEFRTRRVQVNEL